MTKNVKLIYDLIQKDLKAQGWDDEAIAEAIAESQRERQATGADDKTISVKEMSYLSQESLQLLAKMMNNKQKNWFVSLAKGFWHLNWEAKIGILFLIPPIIGVFFFILNLMDAQLGFESFPDSWNCIYGSDHESGTGCDTWGDNYAYGYAYGWAYGYAATPAIPLYLGLMAIAGAYLIKGNLPKKDK
jgi:hypothetical protein